MSRLPDVIAAAALLALFVAAGEAGDWPTLMQYLYQVPFSANDPLYGKDIGFYLFSLPIYIQIKNWMMPTGRAGHILARKLDRLTNRDIQRGNRTMRGLDRREIESIFDQLDALG